MQPSNPLVPTSGEVVAPQSLSLDPEEGNIVQDVTDLLGKMKQLRETEQALRIAEAKIRARGLPPWARAAETVHLCEPSRAMWLWARDSRRAYVQAGMSHWTAMSRTGNWHEIGSLTKRSLGAGCAVVRLYVAATLCYASIALRLEKGGETLSSWCE